MKTNFRVLVDLECLDQLPQSGRRRHAVVAYCKTLAGSHHLGGDFQISDPETGRSFEVTVVEGFIITWWVDQPVKRVVIVDIRRVK